MIPTRRARDLGLPFEGETGPDNAITDVRGTAVGATTLIDDTPRPGRAELVNTGVTAIVPHSESKELLPCWAGVHAFNGNGEMTGSHWIRDGGWFFGPILLTNTHSVGIAHHAAIRWMIDRYLQAFMGTEARWALPVVAETYDGVLNDIDALALEEAHVLDALERAQPGLAAEGNVGGRTGMIAYGHKGGTGTASRRVAIADHEFTLGVLVQANHGIAERLTVCGAPVGRLLAGCSETAAAERGSIIVIIATDVPLLPHQLARVARRRGEEAARKSDPAMAGLRAGRDDRISSSPGVSSRAGRARRAAHRPGG